MSETEALAEGHEPHEKHLQLGVDPDNVPERGIMLEAEEDLEVVWADSTSVEQYKADIEQLAGR